MNSNNIFKPFKLKIKQRHIRNEAYKKKHTNTGKRYMYCTQRMHSIGPLKIEESEEKKECCYIFVERFMLLNDVYFFSCIYLHLSRSSFYSQKNIRCQLIVCKFDNIFKRLQPRAKKNVQAEQ